MAEQSVGNQLPALLLILPLCSLLTWQAGTRCSPYGVTSVGLRKRAGEHIAQGGISTFSGCRLPSMHRNERQEQEAWSELTSLGLLCRQNEVQNVTIISGSDRDVERFFSFNNLRIPFRKVFLQGISANAYKCMHKVRHMLKCFPEWGSAIFELHSKGHCCLKHYFLCFSVPNLPLYISIKLLLWTSILVGIPGKEQSTAGCILVPACNI